VNQRTKAIPLILALLVSPLLGNGSPRRKAPLLSQSNVSGLARPADSGFAPDVILVSLKSSVRLSSRSDLAVPGAAFWTSRRLDSLLADLGAQAIEPVFRAGVAMADSRPEFANLARIFRIRLTKDAPLEKALARLAASADLDFAEPDYIAKAELAPLGSHGFDVSRIQVSQPNDPMFDSQWGLEDISASSAWSVVTGTPGLVLALIDSGIDLSHPDLDNQLWVNPGEIPGNGIDDDNNGYIDDVNGWNFVGNSNDVSDDNGHGTLVAGVAGAETDNGVGIAGMCWSCRLMPVKAMQTSGFANYSDIAAAVVYAASKGARVINLSLGGYSNSSTLRAAIDAASATAVIVGGAGNDNSSAPFYPAAYANVIGVASTTISRTKSGFSNYGTWVKLAAPGTEITTTFLGGDWGSSSGTSLSAPLVSAMAALIRVQHPDWSPDLVRSQLLRSTRSLAATDPANSPGLGAGLMDAAASVQPPKPLLKLSTVTVNGSNLGRANLAGVNDLVIGLSNDWLDATDVSGVLESQDLSVSVVTSGTQFGAMQSGAVNLGTSLAFTVQEASGYNHPILFSLSLQANSGAYTITIPFTVTTESSVELECGTITEDTTWTSEKTHVLACNVGVASGVSLTIQAGAIISASDGTALLIGGSLLADATVEQPIVFRGISVLFLDSSSDGRADSNRNYVSGSILRYVSSSNGINCASSLPYMANLEIDGGINCGPGSSAGGLSRSRVSGAITIKGQSSIWLSDNVVSGWVDLTGRTVQATANQIGGSLFVLGDVSGASSGPTVQVELNSVDGTIEMHGSNLALSNTVKSGLFLYPYIYSYPQGDDASEAGVAEGNIVTGSLIVAPNSYGRVSKVIRNQVQLGSIQVGQASEVLSNTVIFGGISGGSSNLVVANTVEGGGVLAASNSSVYRNFVRGSPGAGLQIGAGTVAYANWLVGNAIGAIATSGVLTGNVIADSIGNGLQIGTATATSNTIVGGRGIAVYVSGGTPSSLTGNNIDGNTGSFDLYVNQPNGGPFIPAQRNWWGITSTSAINSRIWDFNDDIQKASVTFAPVLTQPVVTAPAYVRRITTLPDSTLGIQTGTFVVTFSRPMDVERAPLLSVTGDTRTDGFYDQSWISPIEFSARYDVSSLLIRGVHTITVGATPGSDGMMGAPRSSFTFTVDYAGFVADTTPPNRPVVQGVGDGSLNRLHATWVTTDTESGISLYRYGIGTSPGARDVVNWTTLVASEVTRTGLSLTPGQAYYFTIAARNAGGLWSESGFSNRIVAGVATVIHKVYAPIAFR